MLLNKHYEIPFEKEYIAPPRNAVMSRKLVAPIVTELLKYKKSATYSGANLPKGSVCGGMCRAFPKECRIE